MEFPGTGAVLKVPLPPVDDQTQGLNPPDNLISGEEAFPNLVPPPLAGNDPHISAGDGLWSKKLLKEPRPAIKFKLRFIPPIIRDEKVLGVCHKSAVEGELAVLDLTLVGFFLGRRPSFSLIKSTLFRQWKIHGELEILQLLHGGYAFRFSDLRDRDNILDGDVIFVGGQPMFIRQWERSLHSGGILGLRQVPLWVSLPGLPLHLWEEEALSSIGSVLGNPLYSDRTTAMKSRLAFARICVEFMGDRPLLESISIEDDMGLRYEQKVNYEWKPPHCLSCGVFGHAECGLKEGDMMKETQKSSLERREQQVLGKTNVEICNGIHHTNEESNAREKMNLHNVEEFHEEEGWEVVRAKKKQPIGSGASNPRQNRPGLNRVKPAEKALSTPHWSNQAFKDGDRVGASSYWQKSSSKAVQKKKSDPSQKEVTNLNSKSCFDDTSCLISSLDKGVAVSDFSGLKTVPLESNFNPNVSESYWSSQPLTSGLTHKACPNSKEVEISNFKSCFGSDSVPHPTSGNMARAETKMGQITSPLEVHNTPTLAESGLPKDGSSAGHTPFPNRISILARDIRLRQAGRLGRTNEILDVTSSKGQNHEHIINGDRTVHDQDDLSVMSRSKDGLREQHSDSDIAPTSDESEDELSDFNDPIGGRLETEIMGINGVQNCVNEGSNPGSLAHKYSTIMKSGLVEKEDAKGHIMTEEERRESSMGRKRPDCTFLH